MALPEKCHALRRSYVEKLIERGSLNVESLPTGILVVTDSKTVGIATKKKGKRFPWVSKEMRLKRGALLIPRLLSVFKPGTINVFKQLGKVSPPETQFIYYGNGMLTPIYMYCDGWDEFSRMSQHILSEEGYGVNNIEIGELAEICSIIDQLEMLCGQLSSWISLSNDQQIRIDREIIRLSILLELAIDPYKVSAHDKLINGVRDRLKRINPLITASKSRLAQKRLSLRINDIERIAPIIELRDALANSYVTRLMRKRKSFNTTIESRIKSFVNFSAKGNANQLSNLATALEKTAIQIQSEFVVRPYRYWAHQAASLLKRVANLIRQNSETYNVLNTLEAAKIYLLRIPLPIE